MTAGSRPSPSLQDRIRVLLLACLPQHAVSRLTLRLTRLRTRLKNPVIRWFIRTYGADMSEAAEPDPAAYPSFNAFFTRALRPGARPLAGDGDTPVSPVDGRVSQAGRIEAGRLYQAKGIDYGLVDLVGGDPRDAEPFTDGGFATLYLAPGDYHRIHMPLTGTLRRMCHVPGRLWSVAPWTVRSVPGLFARNERVVALFDTDHGPLGLVLVGAINVAAIETVWAGLVTPPRGHGVTRTEYGDTGPRIERGGEMGRFNMGSTVIVLVPPGVPLDNVPGPGEPVRVGMALARTDRMGTPTPSMA
ncbi:MAG: archaetidylserine decarboxylase [Halofilum sp. (in: g-proteobacteria)]